MIINHNIAALNTHRQVSTASTAQSKSMEKLSSGLRINRAGDDAAGLAISEKMRGQIRGLDMAAKNSQDGIALIQTAEGALNETHDILQRMRELAVQAGNDTNTESDRKEIQKEINQMTSEINRIGNTTEFNTQKLLNGDKDGAAVEGVTAVAGEYKVTVGTSNIVIDGETFTYDAAGDGTGGKFKDAASLATAIGNNANLKDKYTASDDSGALKLVQKTGEETATAPTVTGGTLSTTKAGVDKVDAVAADPTKSLKFQIGANENQSLTLDISDMRAEALGLTSTGTGADRGVTDGTSSTITEQALSVLTHDDAAATVTTIQAAIDKVSAERSKLGANQNRLEHTINNLNTSSENLTAAESRIRDVDMAKEMMNQTKNSILSQAAQAMLAQSNQMSQGVLQLLR
ncbi:flagellin [Bacillus sporothermodurans]|uniref:flagellin N-terminal helical domain-containing protein n=1 Tax=Heyndrickxia sporothermodurans TaxID=46224 RepID=UPI00192B2E82|nr:flagellin [Heyndrickxia sporothermodurans]MBL5771682.1 flagellin [Heyndrickxia sporothermodurans]MBL5775310.1 flagellin [Heyndrickxia sporothermodurans]MBL5789457.1 flagellin [Heyndrickxia sporothermodurans]MBL5800059.1 flagellin [Heyndrickxia sporothermodurans]MBL5811131.1 flagellin [Heyndrickxia sporothermodurans]